MATESQERAGSKRPDLDSEEYRDGAFYKPISTREYFKVLGYCLIGPLAIGLFFIFFSIMIE